jgi:hypothetical protein
MRCKTLWTNQKNRAKCVWGMRLLLVVVLQPQAGWIALSEFMIDPLASTLDDTHTQCQRRQYRSLESIDFFMLCRECHCPTSRLAVVLYILDTPSTWQPSGGSRFLYGVGTFSWTFGIDWGGARGHISPHRNLQRGCSQRPHVVILQLTCCQCKRHRVPPHWLMHTRLESLL